MKKNKIISVKHYLFIFAGILLISYGCRKDETILNFSKIDHIMESAISDSVFPGAVLAFGNSDSVIYVKAFGNFTYEKDSPPVLINSIFDLASLSKVVGTTSAALLLVQEKKLDLNEKVIKYLPQFNNNGKDNIKVKHLLMHNSGLPAFKKYYDVFSTEEEVINDIMRLNPEYPPAEKYIYSDLGMITLQKVIEKVSGKKLNVFLQESLFKKIEMNNTMYNPSNEIKDQCVPTEYDDFWRMRLLQGEVHDERAQLLNGVAGHAGLFSTAEDLAKFAMMILNNGKYNNKVILNSKLLDEWTRRKTELSDRAYGWDTKSENGYSSSGALFSKSSIGHTGYTGTSIWIDKENDLFVILLSNRVHPSRKNNKILKFRPIVHDAVFESVVQ